jgi:DNA-binding NtrC family response regulator
VYANLLGRDGIVASVSFDQSIRGALHQFERAYLQYHLAARARVVDVAAAAGLERTYFYRKCHQIGVPVCPA